jgi:hypothetical protein
MTRRANKAVKSKLSMSSQLNMLQPLLALCSKHHPLRAPKYQSQHIRQLPATKLEMPLGGKASTKKCVRASDWLRARLAPSSVLLVVCLWPTSQLIIILFLILVCFQLLLFILILSFLIANLIPMWILVLLVVIFVPLSYTGRVCDVSPYNADKGGCEKNVPIVTGSTAYTCQISGLIFILVINKGLWFGHKLSHSLLNQNQLQYHGVTVHDNPFNCTTPLSIEHSELTIPLLTSGTNIFLDTRTPTQNELDTCTHLHLTLEVEWNPQTVLLAST